MLPARPERLEGIRCCGQRHERCRISLSLLPRIPAFWRAIPIRPWRARAEGFSGRVGSINERRNNIGRGFFETVRLFGRGTDCYVTLFLSGAWLTSYSDAHCDGADNLPLGFTKPITYNLLQRKS